MSAFKLKNGQNPNSPLISSPEMYCQTHDVFQARLEQFQSKLSRITSLSTVSLITAIAGEIGNNSFDHNLGNWPDTVGIFSHILFEIKEVVLADRGQEFFQRLDRLGRNYQKQMRHFGWLLQKLFLVDIRRLEGMV